MGYFATCLNCAADKSTCARLAEIRQAIKGMSITSVKFKCAERVSMFRRGQRVQFDWRYYDDDRSGEGYTATFYGTIMREKPGNKRFSIRVDQDHEDYDLKPSDILKSPEFTSVRPADIQPIDEPDKPMCYLCSAYREEVDAERLCYAGANGDEPYKNCWSEASPTESTPDV